ncbi:MAG: hypothetical protein ACPGU1_22675 [Myxococcota bacterium]
MRSARPNTSWVALLGLLLSTTLSAACGEAAEPAPGPDSSVADAESSAEEVTPGPREPADVVEAVDTVTLDTQGSVIEAPMTDAQQPDAQQLDTDTPDGQEPDAAPASPDAADTQGADDTTITDALESDAQSPAPDTSLGDVEDSAAEEDSTVEEDAQAVADTEDTEDIAVVDPCPTCPPSEAAAEHAIAAEALTQDLERTRHNPLKGFITSYAWSAPANDFPDQMEFLYLPMADVWGADGDTFEAGLEPLLVAAAARQHQVVLRIYIDYPNKTSGLPGYLAETVPCSVYSDHGGGCSPDYDHPLLVDAMVALINALGERYDADPRLGVIQVGLLGFWGEWHTWPHTEWFPSLATQEAVLTAFDDAFEVTLLQVRRAAANAVSLRIGYHDDSFAYSTLGDIDWFFWPGLITAGADTRWQEVMMGGELRPELQASIFEEGYTLDTYAQDFNTCIQTTHASYMLNYQAFNEGGAGYQGDERAAAEASALMMGYTFELTKASISLFGLHQGQLDATVTLEITQSGVAPFYYPLSLGLSSDALDGVALSDGDLSGLLPGEAMTMTVALGTIPVTALGEAMTLHLMSDMLLEGQEVLLATETPWTSPDGPTALKWDLQCEVDGQTYELGEVIATSDGACPCVCDLAGPSSVCGDAVCP